MTTRPKTLIELDDGMCCAPLRTTALAGSWNSLIRPRSRSVGAPSVADPAPSQERGIASKVPAVRAEGVVGEPTLDRQVVEVALDLGREGVRHEGR